MVTISINGVAVEVEEGSTLLEAARSLGVSIPTLCSLRGRTPFGACRLCVVELAQDPGRSLVTACSYRVREGLEVCTDTPRVTRARRVVAELLLASWPDSSEIRDLAENLGVDRQRFRQEHDAWLSPLGLVP